MVKDYDALVFNPFGKPKRAKTSKNNSEPSFWAVEPFPKNNTSSTKKSKKRTRKTTSKPAPSNDVISNLITGGKNMHSTYNTIKKIRQQRMAVPTDPDEIIQRAKNIKARKKKEKQVEESRRVVIEYTEENRRKNVLDKHGYIRSREILHEQENNPDKELSKSQRLRKFLRR